MKSVVWFEVNRLPWNNTVTYVTRNGVVLVVGGMGTDKHRSALRRCMIQCFKHYEGWEGVHFPEKKIVTQYSNGPLGKKMYLI